MTVSIGSRVSVRSVSYSIVQCLLPIIAIVDASKVLVEAPQTRIALGRMYSFAQAQRE